MTDQLWRMNAVALAHGVRTKQFSATEILRSVQNRIDSKNPQLNAIVDEDRDAALVAAAAADRAVADGAQLGPLHGVPVTIKVNVDVKGYANTNGIPALANNIAAEHSPVVKNLLDAGAIVVGRTNTPEFSMRGTTSNPLYGATNNPWGDDMTPGGSSGGAGSAAAAGFGPIHHGNDIGGSLRFPATMCGVATVKPGQGRVPSYNPSATVERGLLSQLMSVQGVICREVCDVRLGMQSAIVHDPRDPWHVPMPYVGPDIGTPLKVAFTKNSHGYPIHPDIVTNLERAASALMAAGYDVEEVEPPPITEPATAWFSVALLEIQRGLDPAAREHGSATIQKVFDDYYAMSNMVDLAGYFDGVADRTRMVRDWSVFLDKYPLVLTPFLMRPTYPNDYDETFDGAKDLFDSAIYSFGLNYLGFPAGNVPGGYADGKPSGVQIVGRKFREDLILDALEIIEKDVGALVLTDLWAREV